MSNNNQNTNVTNGNTQVFKQQLQKAITTCYSQLMIGCGRYFCVNSSCASHPKFIKMNANEAFIKATKSLKFNETGCLDEQKSEVKLCKPIILNIKPLQSQEILSFKQQNSQEKLIARFIEVFQQPQVLLASFVLNRQEVSEEQSQLDFTAIQDLYSLLKNYQQFDQVLKSLNNQINTPNDLLPFPYAFRIVNIILLSPLLYDPELITDLCKLLSFFVNTNGYDSVLYNYFNELDQEQSIHIIQILQQIITVNVLKQKNEKISKQEFYKNNIIPSILLMKIFEQINSNNHNSKFSIEIFYNDAVNDEIDILKDFENFYTGLAFSFCQYPFLYKPEKKVNLLDFESEIQQDQVIRQQLRQLIMLGGDIKEIYLILRIRRENLMEDALQQLISEDVVLKKPLKVEFVGEQGVDQGGVKKEFFQLIIKEIFDPQFTMFNYYESSRLYYFNPHSYEPIINFELVGTVLGLAAYNGVILDLHLPSVAYKILLNEPFTFEDIKQLDPDLYMGLNKLSNFEGDVETTFCRNFTIETKNLDMTITQELKPNGENIPVTNENREEFIKLYIS